MLWVAVQGFAVGGQPGMGIGGVVVLAALLMLFCAGLAARGAFNGDRFVTGAIDLNERSRWPRGSTLSRATRGRLRHRCQSLPR